MHTHLECYGGMFPDLSTGKFNTPLKGKAFSVLVNRSGFGITDRNSAVDMEQCSGCGTCVEKCQVNAAKFDEQNGYATISLNRCIGCGNCVAACPSEAIKLVKKEKETPPPEDRTDLYKILAEMKP